MYQILTEARIPFDVILESDLTPERLSRYSALVRASRLTGNVDLGERFITLADGLRWAEGGMPADAVREIRRIKARMEAERLPRGNDPRRNAKLVPGGLADIEWTIQLLQRRHAGEVPSLRTPRTLEAKAASVNADL